MIECKTPPFWRQFVDVFVDFAATGGKRIWSVPPSDEELAERKLPPAVLPPAKRIVAIGDLHGDIKKTRQLFQTVGLTNDKDEWIAGDTVAVQVGDQLDRGRNEIEVLLFLEKIEGQAKRHGGQLHVLLGNHETMSIYGDTRFVDPHVLHTYEKYEKYHAFGRNLKAICGVPAPEPKPLAEHLRTEATPEEISRLRLLQPEGVLSRRFFAHRNTVMQIGKSVFVHGGVLSHHVDDGLETINRDISHWIRGDSGPPHVIFGRRSVVWARNYSRHVVDKKDCHRLFEVLERLKASRMIMGHTIQSHGITQDCNGAALRVDIGLSRGCSDATPAALVIENDEDLDVLPPQPTPPPSPAATIPPSTQ